MDILSLKKICNVVLLTFAKTHVTIELVFCDGLV